DHWQETSQALSILDRVLARGDRFICLIGHDGSANLDSIQAVFKELASVEAVFVTLSGLAAVWKDNKYVRLR
ncbi:MAG: hypothetical protein PHR35_18765, partial [Kiritimatiellae bacterium]|nr:hypothetical protein [Kiritimatiellia bacterium]